MYHTASYLAASTAKVAELAYFANPTTRITNNGAFKWGHSYRKNTSCDINDLESFPKAPKEFLSCVVFANVFQNGGGHDKK